MPKKVKTHKFLQTGELAKLVGVKFSHASMVVLEEVRDSTGFGASRSCDMVIVATWPSHGFRITGVEIKRDRSDWLRELKNPKKGNDMQQFMDEFIVVANHGVVKLDVDPVPDTWQVFEPNPDGTKLVCVKQGVVKAERGKVDRAFLCAMLRRAAATSLSAQEKDAIEKHVRGEADKMASLRVERAEKATEAVRETVRQFEEASGLTILGGYNWDNRVQKIGHAVRLILDGDETHQRIQRQLHDALDRVKLLVGDIERHLQPEPDGTEDSGSQAGDVPKGRAGRAVAAGANPSH